jgi:putative transcriptional regulator
LIALGKSIVKLRQQKGWTQSELARNCDKDRQSIERLEKGKINPSAYYLYQISEGLGIELTDLLEAIKKIRSDEK